MTEFTPSILLSAARMPLAVQEGPIHLDPTVLLGGGVALLGIFLLLFGRSVLRTGLAVLGGLLGVLAGNALGENLTLGLSPLACSVIGGLLGVGVGLVLCRITVATVMGCSCGILAGLALLVAIQGGLVVPTDRSAPLKTTTDATPTPSEGPLPAAVASQTQHASAPSSGAWSGVATHQATAAIADRARSAESSFVGFCNQWLSRLNTQLKGMGTRLQSLWGTLEVSAQQALLGTAALGALFGFMLGLVAWKWSSGVVSALVGSALVLLGGVFIAQIITPRLGESLWTLHPAFWLGGWTFLAASGGVISWLSDRRRTDTQEAFLA
ncbi:MAG: hypothetical protein CBC35_09545 [Planctomycetes bacterium TMED75]|nr:hypothetical protein [Planctomycetaceae bacterium]OUU91450.1 MAG: hypothetical protein CBC35_09545 [Planctomycetes bacterium TMED75]